VPPADPIAVRRSVRRGARAKADESPIVLHQADRFAPRDDAQPADDVAALGLARHDFQPRDAQASSMIWGRAVTSRAMRRSSRR
jgi:hypothetical protein